MVLLFRLELLIFNFKIMSIDGIKENREFTSTDVGVFLQNMFGDRSYVGGEGKVVWDVEGVVVTSDEENGNIILSNLNPNQYGAKWIAGRKRNWAISEFLTNQGYRPNYVEGLLTATIPEHEFLAKIEKPREPDFATDGAEEDAFFVEGLSDAINKALARREA